MNKSFIIQLITGFECVNQSIKTTQRLASGVPFNRELVKIRIDYRTFIVEKISDSLDELSFNDLNEFRKLTSNSTLIYDIDNLIEQLYINYVKK